MAFYEKTIVAKQDLAEKDLSSLKKKYSELINSSSGKVLKTEDWGLIPLVKKIKNYNKAFYLHYKFEGNEKTLDEIKNKIKLDNYVLRYLVVKYKKLNIDKEFFKIGINKDKK